MNFFLLYFDELKGFYKSKVMLILWLGLPIITIITRIINLLIAPSIPPELFSVTFLTGTIISAIGGALSAVMLSTSITSEKNKHVYDLFLIRPVKRQSIILSKYFAVITCLFIAIVISYTIGIVIDIFTIALPTLADLIETLESILVNLVLMSAFCSIGIIFGISLENVAASAILSLYIGEQLSTIPMIIYFFTSERLIRFLISTSLGIGMTIAFLVISILVFNKKEL